MLVWGTWWDGDPGRGETAHKVRNVENTRAASCRGAEGAVRTALPCSSAWGQDGTLPVLCSPGRSQGGHLSPGLRDEDTAAQRN